MCLHTKNKVRLRLLLGIVLFSFFSIAGIVVAKKRVKRLEGYHVKVGTPCLHY